VDSTFSVLASVLPGPLREQVQKTLDWMRNLPKSEVYLSVLAKLAEAWTSQRRVKITYRSLPAAKAAERIIEPYFIEPAAPGHSSYVIAYCHRAGELRIFKVERIEAIELTDETYTIPADFDANRYFKGAWGIVVEGEEQTVKLKFSPEIARLMEETIWHPSQVLEKQVDGSVIMTLKVFYTYELVTWILGWGEKVEVLEPSELRKEVLQTAKAMVKIYQKK
jgi:predicted DNA-binding transcriptional regulator YafY